MCQARTDVPVALNGWLVKSSDGLVVIIGWSIRGSVVSGRSDFIKWMVRWYYTEKRQPMVRNGRCDGPDFPLLIVLPYFFLVNLSSSVCRDIQMKGISPWSFSIVHTTERYKTIMELGIESWMFKCNLPKLLMIFLFDVINKLERSPSIIDSFCDHRNTWDKHYLDSWG